MRTKRVTRLWERMAAMYGSRWAFEYGPVLDGDGKLATLAAIWADALEDADNSAISAGLRKCLDRDKDSPPTLPEFLRLCGARTARVDTRPSLPCLPPYADTPRARMERLAKELADQAEIDLAEPPAKAGDDAKQRAQIIRAYWMSKIGATMVGQSLVKAWKDAV